MTASVFPNEKEVTNLVKLRKGSLVPDEQLVLLSTDVEDICLANFD